ncbi:MAG TPA: DUF2059 domain-containing protein, partial [Caulobacteraceae bacterium]
ARAFAKRFDESELTQAIAFYESPVGKKMAGTDDTLVAEMTSVYESITPEMMLDFRRRYCERMPSACSPEDAI